VRVNHYSLRQELLVDLTKHNSDNSH